MRRRKEELFSICLRQAVRSSELIEQPDIIRSSATFLDRAQHGLSNTSGNGSRLLKKS